MDTEYRNVILNEDGSIDCEINHPVFGWIPFTARANDIELHGRIIYHHIKRTKKVKPYEEEPI